MKIFMHLKKNINLKILNQSYKIFLKGCYIGSMTFVLKALNTITNHRFTNNLKILEVTVDSLLLLFLGR